MLLDMDSDYVFAGASNTKIALKRSGLWRHEDSIFTGFTRDRIKDELSYRLVALAYMFHIDSLSRALHWKILYANKEARIGSSCLRAIILVPKALPLLQVHLLEYLQVL